MQTPTTHPTLDAKTVPLAGTNLIEASAGTGKTWTISWLYLRLVAVYGLRVDQILVVTYTEAATAELRDRIRKRLADALVFLEGRDSEEPYEALAEETERADCIQRLQLALVSFDEAAVFTIHGFCKRVLTENAFEARLPFESELIASEEHLLIELADKFWYQHFLTPDNLHLTLLQTHALTPDSLLEDVRTFIGKPYLHTDIAAVDPQAFTDVQSVLQAQLQECAGLWAADKPEIMDVLREAISAKNLNAASYKADKLPEWSAQVDACLVGRMVTPDQAGALEKFSAAFLEKKTNKGKMTPQHPFFKAVESLLERYQPLQEMLPQALEHLRLRLLEHLRSELPLRKQQLGLLTFDDLLLQLDQALQQHPGFAERLASQYRAALIDEFQDTDPIQYAIFARIYQDAPEPRVFYVGDPKQAIYGFRGADIYTYLKAAKSTQQRHTLGKNFRSHEKLLVALNHLFAQSENPFRSEIQYEPVQAGRPQADIFLPDDAEPETALPPVRLWEWASLDKHSVAEVEEKIAAAVADDIARLLNAGLQGTARVGDESLQSKHIAVLVRTGRQGEMVRQALLVRGISSVHKSRESIFATREATELRAVLRAIAEPGNETALKAALVTELFGYNALALYTLDTDSDKLEAQLEAFHGWHKLWQTQGFMPMFRHWLQQGGLQERLLAFTDGERRMTNLLHLAELIHTESRLHGHGMHALIRWLQQKADGAEADETHQLRLESDADLVQIVTIHKSKGLEYGVVYCPFLWNEREAKPNNWFSWHDETQDASRLQAKALASGEELEHFTAAEQAESLRLLYVAVTRAKYHCTLALVSGHLHGFDYYSALGWLLFGSLPQQQAILGKARKGEMQPPERQQLMQQCLQEVVDTSNGLIGWQDLPEYAEPFRYQPPARKVETVAEAYTHVLPPSPKVGSFSGLVAGKEDERPDYDTLAWQVPVAHDALRTAFPRGAQAGSCLHKMLEELDFCQPVAEQRDKVLLPALARHGLAERWLGAAERLLQDVLDTGLFGDGTVALSLAQLPERRRLDELEFYFPVGQLRFKPLQALLHQHLPAEWTEIHAAIDKLKFGQLTGYMKGFIDLVFEADGRFYVVDYKSNELGASPQDYTAQAMQQAMAEHHYYLQYLIYCLALHRYLRLRISGYTWETHVGGVLYLFLRGMQPASPASGVFFHKPDVALMEALDRLVS